MGSENGKPKGGRGGRGRKNSGGRGRGGGGGRSQGGQNRRHKPHAATQSPQKGKAFSSPYEVPKTGVIAPFDLFCSVFLGLMPDGSYRQSNKPNPTEAAKRLGRSTSDVMALLHEYRMDNETLGSVDFDISLARLDIQVAPEGINRLELARGLFEEFVASHPELADAERRYANGEITLPEAPPQAENEGAPRRRSRGRGRKPEGEEGRQPTRARRGNQDESDNGAARAAKGADVAVEPADDDIDGEVLTEEELVGVEAAAKPAAPAERATRKVRRSPARRGG